jgi:Family of unknown function (DUF6011)
MSKQYKRAYHWRYVRHNGESFERVGIERDGSLWNPNGYPEERVRPIVEYFVNQKLVQRVAAIKRGVETRKRRRLTRIAEAAHKLRTQAGIGDRLCCYCCNKAFTDPVSIKRGIGPECWEHVVRRMEQQERAETDAELSGAVS